MASERTPNDRTAHSEAMWFLIAATCLGVVVALILRVGFYSLVRVLRLRALAAN